MLQGGRKKRRSGKLCGGLYPQERPYGRDDRGDRAEGIRAPGSGSAGQVPAGRLPGAA
ncbi:hypothetical protein [Dubosiella newyorkensis]|nr:hypothetical protein [Dubosiella newyorkensis]